MGNIGIKLSSNKKVNNVNRFSDVDVRSQNLERTLYDRNAIRNSVTNILKWKPYERILRPGFGNSLWNNLFELANHSSRSDIVKQVRKMLSDEPRINVVDVDVVVNPEGNSMDVSFSYTIPELDDVAEEYSLTISKA